MTPPPTALTPEEQQAVVAYETSFDYDPAILDIIRRLDARVGELEHNWQTYLDAPEPVVQTLSRQRDELARQLKSAVTVLARHGFCEHAGTWISREEADRISKDGP